MYIFAVWHLSCSHHHVAVASWAPKSVTDPLQPHQPPGMPEPSGNKVMTSVDQRKLVYTLQTTQTRHHMHAMCGSITCRP